MTKIDKHDDVIDSRDIISRISELENERDEWLSENEGKTVRDWEVEDVDAADELKNLGLVTDELSQLSDWEYGVALIRYSYFTDYVEELCIDCGDIPKDLPSYIVIDWERTAETVAYDYGMIEFNGIDYYYLNS